MNVHLPPAWKARLTVATLLAVPCATGFVTRGSASEASAVPAPCSAPEYRAFDFFAGDWDAFEIDNPSKPVARNRVTHILDNCVLLEDYQALSGSHGESFTMYDATRKVWHQTWVTNHGALLTIEGNMRGDEMILAGTDLTPKGKQRNVRGIWKPVPGGVRETATTSIDGGKTWSLWFDLIFRPITSRSANP